MRARWLSNLAQISKFGIVGVIGTLVNVAALVLLVEYAAMPKEIASLVAIEVSIINNFILNNYWTFASRSEGSLVGIIPRFTKFNAVSLGGASITYVVFVVFVIRFNTNYTVAQVAGIIIAFVWNYMANCEYTWNDE